MKTKEELIAFENWCIKTYEDGKLRSPLHLSRNNEDQLIEIFKNIKPNDWVFSTYRSHYHALLKGIDEDWLKNWVLNNKSIHVMNSEHKFFTSAIVGGCLSIALGTAMAIKKITDYGEEEEPHVYCFVGDMTASLGVFQDCLKFAYNNRLPITFIIEDNGLSTDTPTKEAWGETDEPVKDYTRYTKYYKYERKLPHYGIGKFIDFNDSNKPKEDKGF